jgi:chromosome segregation ATPase
VSGLDSKAAADASASLKKQDVITDGTRPGSPGTMDDSKKLDDTSLSGGDAATELQGREKKDLESLEMELKLRLMEEKNRKLEENLNTSRIIEDTKQAKEQSYSNQIAELVEHIQRLEKEVGDSAAKAERALRSREDEIKRMAEVIEVKTKSQSLLEAEREKLLTESNEIRLSAERQSKKDMEALKERLVDSAKSELKLMYDKQMYSITEQLKSKLEQEKSLTEITKSQSKELEGLKEQIDRLQNERSADSSVTISGNSKDPQIDVEEMMETIQNIQPLHDVVLASDASRKEEAPGVGKESQMKNLPTYETFSKGKQKAASLYDTP